MLNESKKAPHYCCHKDEDHGQMNDHQHCCVQHHECSDKEFSFQSLFNCLIDLRDQTLFAHWTVGGLIFASWHALYEEHYNQLNALIDSYVEAALMHNIALDIGGQSSCKKRITGHNFEQSKKHMQALSAHLHHTIEMVHGLIKTDLELCMQDILTEISVVLEKQSWFYKNSLSN